MPCAAKKTLTDPRNNMQFLKKIGNNILKNDNVVFTFIRSSISSQISSWTDMIVSFCMFAWVLHVAWLSTAIGAVCGGIVNCIVGYKFTYHATGVSKRAVAVKFIMVWFGSLVLNSVGTEVLTHLLEKWTWLETIGFKPDGYFAAARLTVSLIVSLAWNFVLQRTFVFRPNRFDSTAIRIVELLKCKR